MKLVCVLVLLLALVLTSGNPLDCSDINNETSGVYPIYPFKNESAVEVYCNMTSFGEKWTVFQRRMDGSVNFFRRWDQYRKGFGNASGEYWLGLETLHNLTKGKSYELLVNMEDFDGKKTSAHYSSFSIDSESEGYRLHVSGFIHGGAGDALTYHNGQRFSTFDKDQDSAFKNCAKIYLGAFWYNACHRTNPNGVYGWGPGNTPHAVGVSWFPWRGHDYSFKTFSMEIRPVR